MDDNNLKKKTISGLIWTFLERIGTQGVNFIVSLVLARLLLPEQYGIIAIVSVIINLFNVFVSSGISNALIQKKDADDIDFSTAFYFNIVSSLSIYALVFVLAPYISSLFEYEQLDSIVRVMGMSLIVGALGSVSRSISIKKMQFRKIFWSNSIGTLISAFAGIIMAVKLKPENGVWALVVQQLTSVVIGTVILIIANKWIPKLKFSFKRLASLFSYGWKILVSNLINSIFEDIRTFIIGLKYTTTDLAYYNKGEQVPKLLVGSINTTIQNVLFPVLSQKQDEKAEVKRIMRRSIKTSAFIIMPMMFGLAAVAKPLVEIVLTNNWIECVPYLQIACISMALMPLQTANLQALYALGRTDITLKLDIAKRTFSITVIIITCFFGVKAIAWGGLIMTLFSLFVNIMPNKKLLKYGYFEQIKDILPFIAMSAVMAGAVIGIGFIPINIYIKLVIQVLVGVVIYVALSAIFKVESFRYILNIIKPYISKIFAKFKRKK